VVGHSDPHRLPIDSSAGPRKDLKLDPDQGGKGAHFSSHFIFRCPPGIIHLSFGLDRRRSGFLPFCSLGIPGLLTADSFLTGALAFSSMLEWLPCLLRAAWGEGRSLGYLLAFLMPASVAVVISILTRLWMTLIEIGLIGWYIY